MTSVGAGGGSYGYGANSQFSSNTSGIFGSGGAGDVTDATGGTGGDGGGFLVFIEYS